LHIGLSSGLPSNSDTFSGAMWGSLSSVLKPRKIFRSLLSVLKSSTSR
jgi:hypothetical protein